MATPPKSYIVHFTNVPPPLLGSINGASTMTILLDHKAEIGFRTVEKVVVFAENKTEHVERFGKLRSFMIVLSDRRTYQSVSNKDSRSDILRRHSF